MLAVSNVAFNQEEATRVIASLKGKQVHQLIAEGHAKIGSGSGPAPAASTTAAKPAAKEAPKKEEPKKVAPKKEEPKAEEDEDLGGLFDWCYLNPKSLLFYIMKITISIKLIH